MVKSWRCDSCLYTGQGKKIRQMACKQCRDMYEKRKGSDWFRIGWKPSQEYLVIEREREETEREREEIERLENKPW